MSAESAEDAAQTTFMRAFANLKSCKDRDRFHAWLFTIAHNVIVDALQESQTPLVPVVGADNSGFVGQLNSVEGLKGAAVTNPGSIGAAGITLALQILDGKKPEKQAVFVEPEIWANDTDEGKAKLKAAADPSLSPEWPVSISIPNWTTYTKDQIVACKGPGE